MPPASTAATADGRAGWLHRFLRPRWGDALLALLMWPLAYSAIATPGWGPPELTNVEMHLWSLAFALPLVWRRTFPFEATLAIIPAHLLQLALMDNFLPANVCAAIMVYAFARYAEPRQARWCLWMSLASCLAAGIDWGQPSDVYPTNSWDAVLIRSVFNGGGCLAVVAACWFAGQWARQKDLVHQSWRERAEALERERARGVALVAQEERNRLAREMHDIVAHSLSVIVVQADGAGYLAGHDELGDAEARLAQVNSAIATIGQTARTALDETRRLVGVLRQDGEEIEMAPAATLDQIADLVAQLQTAGAPATFHVEGDPAAHPPLGEGAQMAAYRVVQESLTNVLKHAGPGASVDVTLSHDARGISLRIADTGSGPGASTDGHYGDGLGHGLVGMRERMAAWGGHLNAGPRKGGGFEVHAILPAMPPPATRGVAPAPGEPGPPPRLTTPLQSVERNVP
ncbi:sensor histidine kinase [Luteococcus sp. Sow4_B9]|uniref:sensor histidine kinase n=1 Tax=Luteococcus sp. Sow4_B9 TaxID=3438792 RepID=UPI003F9B85FF